MACPFSSATDWIGESAATSTAVCSRTVIASSLGRQPGGGDDGGTHAGRGQLDLAGRERLIFRSAVGEQRPLERDIVLLLDLGEQSHLTSDVHGMRGRLDADLDDFLRPGDARRGDAPSPRPRRPQLAVRASSSFILLSLGVTAAR